LARPVCTEAVEKRRPSIRKPTLPSLTGDFVGLGMLAIAGVGYGAASICAKLAYAHGAPTSNVLAARFVLGAGAVWGVALARHAHVPARGLAGRAVVATGIFYTGGTWLFIASLRHIEAPTASLLSYAYPAIVALVMIMFGGERLSRRLAAILALALAGVVLVAQAPLTHVGALGAALALGSAVSFALYIVSSGAIAGDAAPLTVSALVLTVALGVFVIGTAALGGATTFRAAGAGWAVAAGVIGGLITPFYQAAVSRLGPTKTAVGGTFAPLATAALAALVLGEQLNGTQLLGGALILASLAFLPARRNRSPLIAASVAPPSVEIGGAPATGSGPFRRRRRRMPR
jgi:drug/metabolite transporter (DMT)-like permease